MKEALKKNLNLKKKVKSKKQTQEIQEQDIK